MNKQLSVEFKGRSGAEYTAWQKEDKRTVRKINKLIKDTLRHPFKGEGSPEPLLYDLSGYWSRMINKKDRMVYRVLDDRLQTIQLKYHYTK